MKLDVSNLPFGEIADSTHDDDVESSLHQAQELIRHAMSSRRGSRQIRHLPGDDAAFLTTAFEIISQAHQEVLCVLAARQMSDDHRHQTFRLLHAAQARGVHVKTLVPSPADATSTAMVRAMTSQPGCRIRDLPDQILVITDGREAALRTPPTEEEPAQTMLISVRPLVHVLRNMFGLTWNSGLPLREDSLIEKLRGEPARSILSSLNAGETDEVAARKLGISVRTYRRHVADIMREIRANSRFQAGARAAELGIIL